MAYPSLTMIMLISAPGDVDPEDLRVVQKTINRWNFRAGRRMVPTPVTVLPVSWSDHAYSEFGVRPQGAINEQLVKEADLAFAMFANRLGTPTGEADSGTVEEMEVMRQAGKHVSIVRSTAPVSLQGVEATAEKGRLESFLEQIKRERALVYEYARREDLAAQVEHVLSSQTEAFANAAGSAGRPVEEQAAGAVVPSTEVVESVETGSGGRLRTRKQWYLVLTNETGRPVRNVQFEYSTREDEETTFDLRAQHHEAVPHLGPGARVRFPITRAMGSADQAECTVSWQEEATGDESLEDAEGVQQYRTTVRAA